MRGTPNSQDMLKWTVIGSHRKGFPVWEFRVHQCFRTSWNDSPCLRHVVLLWFCCRFCDTATLMHLQCVESSEYLPLFEFTFGAFGH